MLLHSPLLYSVPMLSKNRAEQKKHLLHQIHSAPAGLKRVQGTVITPVWLRSPDSLTSPLMQRVFSKKSKVNGAAVPAASAGGAAASAAGVDADGASAPVVMVRPTAARLG